MLDFERKGCDQYGASMGRQGGLADARNIVGKVRLVRVKLDAGGYDSGGAYWGQGGPLFLATGYDAEGFEVNAYLRDNDRACAKAWLLSVNPLLKFYR